MIRATSKKLRRAALLAAWLGLSLGTSGCLGVETTRCEWGEFCPSGRICEPIHKMCVLKEQLKACEESSDGEACTFAGTHGVCDEGVCIQTCGNGILDQGEACDDGNRQDGDGCSKNCLSDETCGNGLVDYPTGETCDCGEDPENLPPGCDAINSNTNPAATCDSHCQRFGAVTG